MSSTWSNVPITCLSLNGDHILAGQGHVLLLIDRNGVVKSRCQIFRGSNIHTLTHDEQNNTWIVVGAKSYARIRIHKFIIYITDAEQSASDWIFSCFISDDLFLLTAHNKIEVIDSELTQVKFSVEAASGPCILYSGHLVRTLSNNPLVFAGTVTGEVLIWNSCNGDEVYRLSGHDGVIFSINYCPLRNLVCTTSDDRSSRIFRVAFKSNNSSISRSFEDWSTAEIIYQRSVCGHSARIFRSWFSESDVLVTAGEDGRLIGWNLQNGDIIFDKICNNGSAVWSLTGFDQTIITGGGDGSITRWNIAIILGLGRSIYVL